MDKSITAMCFKCKKAMPFAKAELVKTPKGRWRLQGEDQFGHKMSKFISAKDVEMMRGAGLLGAITGHDFGPLSKIPLLGMLF
jgi:hypothetical protein